MYEPLIEVKDLHKYFRTDNKDIHVLNGINFKINKGECVGILGENGSGKTTLLKLLSGILHPSKGSITVKGRSLPLLELGIGFHPELTGKENILLYSSILGIPNKMINTKIEEIIRFSELDNFIEEKLRTYSLGMKLRLAFSISIQCPHDIFLIDEVLAVGDIGFQKKCVNTIKAFKEEGRTIVFASHNFELVKKTCDRAILLCDNTIKFDGDVEKAFTLMRESINAKHKNTTFS